MLPNSCALSRLFGKNFQIQKPITITVASNKKHPPPPPSPMKRPVCVLQQGIERAKAGEIDEALRFSALVLSCYGTGHLSHRRAPCRNGFLGQTKLTFGANLGYAACA